MSNAQFKIERATRRQKLMRIAFGGKPGAGKSLWALQFAMGLTGGDMSQVCVINTEFNRGDLYADLGQYALIEFNRPITDRNPVARFYSPEQYTEVLKLAESGGFPVIIIDGISQEWQAVLDMVESDNNNKGLSKWKEPKARHTEWWDRLMRSPAHIIVTCQSKTVTVQEVVNGKTVITEAPEKEIQDPQIFYSLFIHARIDRGHSATIIKDCTGLFGVESEIPPEGAMDMGVRARQWCEQGAEPPARATTTQRAAMQHLLPALPEAAAARMQAHLSNPALTEAEAADIITKAQNFITTTQHGNPTPEPVTPAAD